MRPEIFSDELNEIVIDDIGDDISTDVLIALHACDTATDDAIWTGIQSNARIIVVAPCCHKQLRMQIDKAVSNRKHQRNFHAKTPIKFFPLKDNYYGEANVNRAPENEIEENDVGILSSISLLNIFGEYGTYRDRITEMTTDTIRSLVLQLYGYETNVFEFVGSEHTAKNVMITAIKNHKSANKVAEARRKLDQLVSSMNIESQRLLELASKVSY